MVSKDIWLSYTKQQKTAKVVECINQLQEIESGTHVLSKTRETGRLCHVKKDLEKFIINTASWEAEQKKHSDEL